MSAEDRQIQAMIEFIDRDAQEKVREYGDEAQAVYDSEKSKLVEAAKEKVIANVAEQKKSLEVNRRVERAQISKKERMRVMDARNQVLEQLKTKVQDDVRKLAKDAAKYKAFLTDLLVESGVTIASDATVSTVPEDEAVVKGLLKSAQETISKKIGKEIKLTMASEKLAVEEAWGGVLLRSAHGRPVTCNNTLAARTRNCIEEQLPTIRYYLFHDQAAL